MIKNYLLTLVALILAFNNLHTQPVRLVKDITPGTGSTFSSDFEPEDDGIILSFGENILFMVKDSDGSFGLWVSNGEEDGTNAVHELNTGAEFKDFVNDDESNVYYSVETSTERHLYALSKATLDTTKIHSNPERINYLTYLNGQLYFEADDALLKVDPGTQVSELVYQFGSFRGIRGIGVLNDGLIIIGGESNGTELYHSDGTTAGTQAYFQLNDGSDFSGDYYMTQVGDQLFFFYNKPSAPYVLYVTDGTAAGTLPLIDLQRISNVDLEKRRSIIAWDGKLFFRGRDLGNGSNQDELFVSDGTVAGTFKININDEWSKPSYFTPYNGELYFMADDFGFVFNVYKTDGTQAGTVKAIDAGSLGGGISFGGNFMVAHQDSLYFYGFRSEVGEELWVSGGTTNTTRNIDIVPGPDDSVPTQITSTDNYLFLIYNSPEYGKELFVIDPDFVNTDELFAEKINVYPNPFSDYLVVDILQKVENIVIEIFDVNGQLVLSKNISSGGKVGLPELPSGSYYAVLKKDEMVVSKKLIRL